MKINQGFTLTEMLVVMSIIGVVATMGVPGFQSLLQKQRLQSARQELLQLTELARTTAINESAQTVICGSSNGEQCDAGTTWRGNVIVFEDNDYNHTRNAGDTLIQTHSLGNAHVRGTRGLLEFNASGAGYMGSWTYCGDGITPTTDTFRLIVSLGGRIRSEATPPQRCG